MSEVTMKIRLFEAIYVLGAALSVWILFINIPHFIGSYYQLFEEVIFIDRNPKAEVFQAVLLAIASYATGWGVRWIATGKTKFRIDLSN